MIYKLRKENIYKLCQKYHIGRIEAIITILKCQNLDVAIEYLHLKKLEKYERKNGFFWISNITGKVITDKEIIRVARKNVIVLQHYFGKYAY